MIGESEKNRAFVMIDRGHREVPIQPDFCGRAVPAGKDELIDLGLSELDGEGGFFM